MQSSFSKGVMFALCAAALNATIGVLSKVLMSNGFTASSVAVIKTLLGCMLLSILLLFLKRPASTAKWTQAAICAFLGIFVLFHFETSAYRHYAAAGVVVVLMASASISSIILGRIFLKDTITANATPVTTLPPHFDGRARFPSCHLRKRAPSNGVTMEGNDHAGNGRSGTTR